MKGAIIISSTITISVVSFAWYESSVDRLLQMDIDEVCNDKEKDKDQNKNRTTVTRHFTSDEVSDEVCHQFYGTSEKNLYTRHYTRNRQIASIMHPMHDIKLDIECNDKSGTSNLWVDLQCKAIFDIKKRF